MEKHTLHLSSGDVVTFKVEGRLHNPDEPAYQEFYPDGTPKRFMCYLNGKVTDLGLTPAVQEFYPDGSIKSRNSYCQNVPNLCLDFHDGKVYSRYEFENGTLVDSVEKSKKTGDVKKTWTRTPGGFEETNSIGYRAYFDSEMRLHHENEPCLVWSSDVLGVGNAKFEHGRLRVWNSERSQTGNAEFLRYTDIVQVYQHYLDFTPEYTYGDQTSVLNIFPKLVSKA